MSVTARVNDVKIESKWVLISCPYHFIQLCLQDGSQNQFWDVSLHLGREGSGTAIVNCHRHMLAAHSPVFAQVCFSQITVPLALHDGAILERKFGSLLSTAFYTVHSCVSKRSRILQRCRARALPGFQCESNATLTPGLTFRSFKHRFILLLQKLRIRCDIEDCCTQSCFQH